ncbi:28584_t:CDS:2 [Gigaspora margarita]|uniref:28584_t:CDS:1 n=1 Tax=Gigaspora margarita TaxID=4874 RepID=A0ABM8VZC5_GIGMA|nr:28584_t:CDS:2 [Gigaspora margarita]
MTLWFDLANFDNQQYPLSEIPQFSVLKSEKYWAFKAMVARRFGFITEQIRFWVFIIRENMTVRPNKSISDDCHSMTMDEVHKQMAAGQNELKLFMEVTDKPIKNNEWFPGVYSSTYIIFIKFFNPDTQSLEGLGHLYVDSYVKVCTILPILCKKKAFPPHTPLKIYNETQNSIQEMKLNLSFRESKIQNAVIERNPTQTLIDMLQKTYMPNSPNLLYYEMLDDISIVKSEPETSSSEED